MKLGFLAKSFLPDWFREPRGAVRAVTRRLRGDRDVFLQRQHGTPKGVMLSHSNVLSNAQSVLQVILGPGDAVLGILPFFHSFGYTVTLWTTLLSGSKAVYPPILSRRR